MKCEKDLSQKKKNIKTMNTKMTTNSQLSISETNKEPNTQKQTKQTTRTGTESQKWRTWRVRSGGGGEGE